jgi:hypothetical protein
MVPMVPLALAGKENRHDDREQRPRLGTNQTP